MAHYSSTWPPGLHGRVLEIFRALLPLRMHRGISEASVAAAQLVVDSVVITEEEQRTGLPRETIGLAVLLALAERVDDPFAKAALLRAWDPKKTLPPNLTDRRVGDIKTATTLENRAIADVARQFVRLRDVREHLGEHLELLYRPDPELSQTQPRAAFDQSVRVKFVPSPTYESATARITVTVRSSSAHLRTIMLPTNDYLHAVVPSDEARQLRARIEAETRGVRVEPLLTHHTLQQPLGLGGSADIDLGPRTVLLARGRGQAVGMVFLSEWTSLTIQVECPFLYEWPAEFLAAVETPQVKMEYERGLVGEEDDWFSRMPLAKIQAPEFLRIFGSQATHTFEPQPAGTKCVVGWFRPNPENPPGSQ